ncbi:MAG: hypothetical protein AUI63_06700 [Gemmatimonadetes bacterium 13_1_40CM_2_60_3]|nr:MAG: hypothetical protein AUI63_06700 [Gemmatimonadetes bacterium 13_1_40CM_2_60_3]
MAIRGSEGLQAHPSTIGEGERSAREQCLKHFLDEKRIAIREGKEHLRQFSRKNLLLREDRMQHRLDLRLRETTQDIFKCYPFTIELCHQTLEARMSVLAAIGQHEQERMRCAATRQIMEKFQTGIVTPMQVFQHDEERRGVGLTGEDLGQAGKEAALLLFGIQWRQWWNGFEGGKEFRQQRNESGSERTQRSCDARPGIGCQQRAQEVEQRAIGAAPVCRETASL